MVRRVLALCLVLSVAPLSGCAVPAIFMDAFGENVIPEVDESANAFIQNVRWGRLQQASLQMVPEKREQFFELFDGDPGDFRFTSVEVLTTIPKGIDGREVDVLVAWEFYSPPALTERRLRQKQTWRFLELERRWEVTPDFAVFEAALAPPVGAPVPASPQR